MVLRKPVVIGGDGLPQQLQAGDTISGPHAKFTGTTSTAFAIALGGTQTMTLTVTPVVAGDVLAAGEDVTIQPNSALPQGINIAWHYVPAQNQVAIGFTSGSLINVSQSISWRVTAHR
ncbi:hypothetical protein ACQKQD_18600 [Methylobacterium sp. NPDC080182]|uniref:hypothetical protein n=1 Tax=Methylobacterium sp. NPDC080182 TaxID=3390590 RepID=UPI003D006712